MPSGYTADIAKGITFKQYAMNCARAFGACIDMRDDPSDTPIPDEFKPSDYHSKRMVESHAKIAKLKSMTVAECKSEAKSEYEETLRYHKDAIKKDVALKRKYEAMLVDVEKWSPPTKEHEGLKKFMREQIEESIKFDCSGNYHQDAIDGLKQLSGKAWRKNQIDQCLKSIASDFKSQKAESERAASRTLWVRHLRNSLP